MRKMDMKRHDAIWLLLIMTLLVCLSPIQPFQIATGPIVDRTNNGFMTTDSKTATTTKMKQSNNGKSDYDNYDTTNRRMLLHRIGHGMFTTIASTSILVQPTETVNAFANKISNKYDDRPKRRGPQVCFYNNIGSQIRWKFP
jgi:stalled ribosome rescue protein Dom34